MVPSLEIREEAARLHEEMTKAEDVYREGRDHGEELAVQGWLAEMERDARNAYAAFEDKHSFRLMTDASGLCLRCAKTNIPLVDTDDTVESEGDRLVMREKADAA